MGQLLGCLVWIIVFVCMAYVDEPWAETLAWITGILITIGFIIDYLFGGGGYSDRNDEQN